MESLKGHFLIASPHLADPNFLQAVVLMVHHDEERSLGLVLNRLGDNMIQDVWDQVGDRSCENDRYICVGGPVPGPLMALHSEPSLSEMEIVPGVYFSAEKEHLEELVRRKDISCLLFAGHSGWGGGQLEDELEEGSWFTMPATSKYVFWEGDELWAKVTQEVGEAFLMSVLQIKRVPEDPTTN